MPKSITAKIVECRTPRGRTLRMERWYYDNVRNALLEILPEPGVHAEVFELQKRVYQALDVVTRDSLDSLSWLVAWVSLDLQQEGVLSRDAGFITRVA
ncbi:MAG: hypothetical protein K8I27_00600 [Planctomycetes bacterium]|nr:hypothetical protein [Planctomycetota bacterium]